MKNNKITLNREELVLLAHISTYPKEECELCDERGIYSIDLGQDYGLYYYLFKKIAREI